MNREQRHSLRRSRQQGSLSPEALASLLARMGITPTPSRVADFQKWMLREQWNRYNQEVMDKYTTAQEHLDMLSLALPNGRKGEHYTASLHLDCSGFQEVWMENAEAAGLTAEVDPDKGVVTVSGIPPETGDFELKLCCRLKGWLDGDPILTRKFNVAFNPHPRDLWREIPVADDIEYPKPDVDCVFIRATGSEDFPAKSIVAASKRGRSHAQEGKPRDDDFVVSFNPDDGWYLLAVADGAGSARYSREGSRIACETVEQFCRLRLAEQGSSFREAVEQYASIRTQETLKPVVEQIHTILFKAAAEAHKAIAWKAEESGDAVRMKDFSTTLLLAVCRRFSFGWFIASFGVGDGAIAVYAREAETVRLLNESDGGEYAGQTRFLTMESIFRDRTRIKMTIVPDFIALILMTDGISDPFFETDANLARKEKWDSLWDSLSEEVDFTDDNPEAAEQLLGWLDFWSPGNHDDRTIAILY